MAQISIIQNSDILDADRFDAEFFKADLIALQQSIDSFGSMTITELQCVLDCSAFYPSITEEYNFDAVGIPFLRVNEIQKGLVRITEETAFLPEKIINKYSSNIKLALPGDIIIAKGGNSLAKVGLLTDSYKYYSVCRDLIIIRTKNIINIDSYYLWLFLHGKVGQKIMLRTASQTGQPHLTIQSIKDLSVPINTKNKKTSKIAFDISIQKQLKSKQLHKKAEMLLLEELGLLNYKPKHYVFFETTCKKVIQTKRIDAEYFQPKYEKIIERIENYSGGFDFVKKIINWKKSIEVGTNAYTNEGKGFIRVSDFSVFGIEDTTKKISDDLFEEIKDKFQPQKGEILFTKDGTIGISSVVKKDYEGVLSGAFLRLTLKKNYQHHEKECLALIFNSILCKLQVKQLSGGAIIAHLKPSDFEKFRIPLIKLEIQKQITEKIHESYKLKKESKEILEEAKRKVEEEIERK